MVGKYESSRPATKREPCPICGKTDHCWKAYFGAENGWLHYCAKGGQPSVFGHDGRKYLLKDNSRFPGGKSGGYHVYEAEEQQQEQRERYVAMMKAKNPHYRGQGSITVPMQRFTEPAPEIREAVEIDHVDPLPNRRLHQVYSYLLELLVLEDSHRNALLAEWNSGSVDPNLGLELLEKWPIRSLPMNDRARRESGVVLKNKTRRQIIAKLVERFGSLKGVPGFFLETTKWNDRVTGEPREDTHWQMVGLSGIVFPCYDTEGCIYRIRIGDEHPVIGEFARDENGNYLYHDFEKKVMVDGEWSTIVEKRHVINAEYRWDRKTGEWYREDCSTREKKTVFSPQKGIFSMRLTEKGYPAVDGKIDGKYKNFSSYYREETVKDGQRLAFNAYAEGCQSGSAVSVYTNPGDNMDFAYVTEGEKKAMVMNHFLKCPVVSIPGVHTFSKLFSPEGTGMKQSVIDWLKANGLKAVIIVFDADKATNDAVLSAEEGAIERCRENGIFIYVGEWDARYGKGADDILIQGKQFEFYEK